jgi:phage gp37-like protein
MRMAASLRTILALELKARSSPDAMTTIRELLLIEQRLALVSSVVPSVVMKLVNAS